MNQSTPISPAALLTAALAATVFAAVAGVAFAAWIDKGAAIFVSMAATGLAWCF